ncbi:MAG: hypothetical protein HY652_10090 [Acidobacteria bacterium]|nr:hypothetical protein [Acidobacteriota bacterium]
MEHPGAHGTDLTRVALQLPDRSSRPVPVLPQRTAEFLRVVSSRYSWLPGFEWRGDGQQHVSGVMRAVNESESLALHYHSLPTDRVRWRIVDPYHLFYWNNSL